ncbi:MAG: hypothetical protein ACK4WF_08680, partial [Candidatus Brocadiales bacterium]
PFERWNATQVVTFWKSVLFQAPPFERWNATAESTNILLVPFQAPPFERWNATQPGFLLKYQQLMMVFTQKKSISRGHGRASCS